MDNRTNATHLANATTNFVLREYVRLSFVLMCVVACIGVIENTVVLFLYYRRKEAYVLSTTNLKVYLVSFTIASNLLAFNIIAISVGFYQLSPALGVLMFTLQPVIVLSVWFLTALVIATFIHSKYGDDFVLKCRLVCLAKCIPMCTHLRICITMWAIIIFGYIIFYFVTAYGIKNFSSSPFWKTLSILSEGIIAGIPTIVNFALYALVHVNALQVRLACRNREKEMMDVYHQKGKKEAKTGQKKENPDRNKKKLEMSQGADKNDLRREIARKANSKKVTQENLQNETPHGGGKIKPQQEHETIENGQESGHSRDTVEHAEVIVDTSCFSGTDDIKKHYIKILAARKAILMFLLMSTFHLSLGLFYIASIAIVTDPVLSIFTYITSLNLMALFSAVSPWLSALAPARREIKQFCCTKIAPS